MDDIAIDIVAKLATDALPATKVNYIGTQLSRALSLYTLVQVLDTHNTNNWLTPIWLYLDSGTLLASDL